MLRKRDQQLMDELTKVHKELAIVRGELEARVQERDLTEEVRQLKLNIVNLEVAESKLKEKYERERRETEHMVGLERKRQEFEVEQAKREATVSIREEALAADRKRFEEQMQFIEGRMTEEVRYLKDDILKGILERLPTWNTEHIVTEER